MKEDFNFSKVESGEEDFKNAAEKQKMGLEQIPGRGLAKKIILRGTEQVLTEE